MPKLLNLRFVEGYSLNCDDNELKRFSKIGWMFLFRGIAGRLWVMIVFDLHLERLRLDFYRLWKGGCFQKPHTDILFMPNIKIYQLRKTYVMTAM